MYSLPTYSMCNKLSKTVAVNTQKCKHVLCCIFGISNIPSYKIYRHPINILPS